MDSARLRDGNENLVGLEAQGVIASVGFVFRKHMRELATLEHEPAILKGVDDGSPPYPSFP